MLSLPWQSSEGCMNFLYAFVSHLTLFERFQKILIENFMLNFCLLRSYSPNFFDDYYKIRRSFMRYLKSLKNKKSMKLSKFQEATQVILYVADIFPFLLQFSAGVAEVELILGRPASLMDK